MIFNDIFIFNADSDLAIANKYPHYMPPARIRKMNSDLEALSIYLAEADDLILLRRALPGEFQTQTSDLLGYDLHTYSYNHLDKIEALKYRYLKPWGWSPQIHQALSLIKGFADTDYAQHPSLHWSDHSRFISGKGIVCDVLPKVLQKLSPVKASISPEKISTIEDLERYVSKKHAVVKAPWSSSGKDVRFMIQNKMEKMELEWSHGIFKQQGFVTAAQYVEKIQDFAMQFYMDESGNVTYKDLSLFFTNDYGQYQGNYILTDSQIEEILCKYITKEELYQVRSVIIDSLKDVINKSYIGYFGVDMMIFRDEDGQYRIHPMVEINLRNNMGILAACIRNKIVYPRSRGKYYVDFESDASTLGQKVQQLEKEYPLQISEGKITKGFYRLTPDYSDAQYIAYIIID